MKPFLLGPGEAAELFPKFAYTFKAPVRHLQLRQQEKF